MTIVIIVIAAYLLLHLAAEHAHYARRRRRGHRGVSVYWNSAMRGPWVSIPLPFGFRIGRRL